MPFALSTAWNASFHHSGSKIVAEIAEFGFKNLELSFNLTPRILKDITSQTSRRGISITSLHNYCPVPDGISRRLALPDCLSLSSPDSRERAEALKYTKRSIDTATRLNAGVLVLHCGRVEMKDRTREMIALYAKDAPGSRQRLSRLSEEYRIERKRKHAPFFASALKSLDELNRYAEKSGVYLGVETRFYHREIPSFEEIGIILNTFRKSQLGYWHDTGHAEVSERLGFGKHKDFLRLYASNLLGIHLHDVRLCRDHLAPLTGEIDFKMLKPYLKKNTLKVIEAHYPATGWEIKQGLQYLERLFDA